MSHQLQQLGQVGAQARRIEAGSVAQNHEAVRIDHVHRHAASAASGLRRRAAGRRATRRRAAARAASPARGAAARAASPIHSTSTRSASLPDQLPDRVELAAQASHAGVGAVAPAAPARCARCARPASSDTSLPSASRGVTRAQVGRRLQQFAVVLHALPGASRRNAARRRRSMLPKNIAKIAISIQRLRRCGVRSRRVGRGVRSSARLAEGQDQRGDQHRERQRRTTAPRSRGGVRAAACWAGCRGRARSRAAAPDPAAARAARAAGSASAVRDRIGMSSAIVSSAAVGLRRSAVAQRAGRSTAAAPAGRARRMRARGRAHRRHARDRPAAAASPGRPAAARRRAGRNTR